MKEKYQIQKHKTLVLGNRSNFMSITFAKIFTKTKTILKKRIFQNKKVTILANGYLIGSKYLCVKYV